MTRSLNSIALLACLLSACDSPRTTELRPMRTAPLAIINAGEHHSIQLVSHTGYPGSGVVNVSPTASDPGPSTTGFTVQGQFTLHGTDPNHVFFVARKADFMPPVIDCTTVAAWNPFVEWIDKTTPTVPPVFTRLETSNGGAGAAHFYVRSTSPLLSDGVVFSVRFALLDDTNGNGQPDAGDTEAYVTDGCVSVAVK